MTGACDSDVSLPVASVCSDVAVASLAAAAGARGGGGLPDEGAFERAALGAESATAVCLPLGVSAGAGGAAAALVGRAVSREGAGRGGALTTVVRGLGTNVGLLDTIGGGPVKWGHPSAPLRSGSLSC